MVYATTPCMSHTSQGTPNCQTQHNVGDTIKLHHQGIVQTSSTQTKDESLLRRRGAGRPYKAPKFRDALFQWFVDIRAAVAARISPRLVTMKAMAMCEQALAEMRRTGAYSQLPSITSKWLYGWKQQFGISFRKPNAKFKCSRAVLERRLRAMWLTNIRVRALATLVFGHDLPMLGFDQKGLHMNETGSKDVRTLCLRGAPVVPLKENHAATRDRFSLMTTVTSCADQAVAAGGPALEVLFRGKTNRIIRGLVVPAGSSMSSVETQLNRCIALWFGNVYSTEQVV